jgi:translation initiation factor 3 subunit C
MSRFFRSAGSESDSESSEDELLSTDDEAIQKTREPAEKSAMSRFLKSDSSDSETDEEDSDSDSDVSDPDSDESEERGAVKILSAHEKRLAEMEAIGKLLDNALKINDWVAISSGVLDTLCNDTYAYLPYRI